MKRLFATLFLATALAACAITGDLFGPSPEAQIYAGANGVTAAATLATVLLKNDKITAANAKSYSAILHTASGHLNTANATLTACRKATSSSATSRPDPCAAGIEADIRLAVSVAGEVQRTLSAKQ